MKNLIALLGLDLSNSLTEEQIAAAVEKGIQDVVAERNTLKTENEKHVAALKTRVTNRVQKAIDDKLIKAERKDNLIASGITNEASLDFLDDIQPPTAGRRGAAPVPRSDDEPATLDEVRNEMRDHKHDALKNAQAALKARELRGHKNLFADATA